MTRKRVKKTTKSVFGDFFDTFLTLRAGRHGKTVLRLFGIWGLGGVETPVYGGSHRKGNNFGYYGMLQKFMCSFCPLMLCSGMIAKPLVTNTPKHWDIVGLFRGQKASP